MSLDDGLLTPAALRKLAAQRQLERFGKLVDPHLGSAASVPAYDTREVERLDPALSAPLRGRRAGDTLTLSIETPPRTKKNNRQHGVTRPKVLPSKAFLHYQRELAAAIGPVAAQLQLPLPDRAYNCAAIYCVDQYGAQADLCGLDQGLYDALQHCGVLSDDWWIRQHDGSRIHLPGMYEGPPRVEFSLTPLLSPLTP
jgi:hypothetical protein